MHTFASLVLLIDGRAPRLYRQMGRGSRRAVHNPRRSVHSGSAGASPSRCVFAAAVAALALVVCGPLRAEEADPDNIIDDCANFEPAHPVAGSLVICGGGKLPEPVLNSFLQLAGGDGARIVVIPTASSLAGTPEVEKKLEFFRRAKLTALNILHTRSRTVADDPAFVKPLEQATGVWFTGGFQWRLADTYLGTAVERLVHAVLDRGGVVGGTSSGAAVMSTLMIRRSNPDPEVGRGFDFLPGAVIDQHFIKRGRQSRLASVVQKHPGFFGLGIDEGTAVVAQGRRLRVIGDSQVLACLPAGHQRPLRWQVLRAGDEADLVALSRAAIARAAANEPPAQAPPEVPRGTLVIVGGGRTPPEAVQQFITAAGGPQAPLVMVTTAQAERPTDEEATAWLRKAGAKNVRQLYTSNRATADDPLTLEMLTDARGVWFDGGRQWRLVDAYLGTKAEKLFHAVLASGGVIGGTSAGATIQASYLLRGSPLGNTEVIAEGYERGFGFLPGTAIDQHFSQRNRLADMRQVVARHPELVCLGLDEDTAIVVRGRGCTVLGGGAVSVFPRSAAASAGDSFAVLRAGDRWDFQAARAERRSTVSAERASRAETSPTARSVSVADAQQQDQR